MAAGIAVQPRRGAYGMPPHHVVPVLATLAAALDLQPPGQRLGSQPEPMRRTRAGSVLPMSGSPLLEPDVLERARRRLGVAALGTAISSAEGTRHLVVGTTSTAGGDLVTEQDAWHLGSCTKSLTAAVYARLVETGRATWTATVAESFQTSCPTRLGPSARWPNCSGAEPG